jgi:site-specific DNA-methyltransferase (adenine-specific)
VPDKFNIVYADPPWMPRDGGNGRAAAHYSLMKTTDVCRLPVKEITADDCALFLWATFPCLPDALQVVAAWGFRYKSVAFTWIKPNRKSKGWALGTGFWTRANAEICLLATKGHPKIKKNNIPQLIVEPRREHSRKPEVVRKRIIDLFGDVPRVELFARQKTVGWCVWGDQVESDITLHVEGSC